MQPQLISINPSVEALQFGNTLAIFAGDRCVTIRGHDGSQLFARLRALFVTSRTESDIEKLDQAIYKLLPELLSAEVLLINRGAADIHFFGRSMLNEKIESLLSSRKRPTNCRHSILICLPDSRSLEEPKEALSALKDHQALLTGISRGTTVFVLPLIRDKGCDISELFSRLLSTEAGIGNAYFAQELIHPGTSEPNVQSIEDNVADWVASDLYASVAQGRLNEYEARIYRGSLVLREEVPFSTPPIYFQIADTAEEKAIALAKMFVGLGGVISRFRDYTLGSGDTKLFAVNAETARPQYTVVQEEEDRDVWGTGETISAARLAAFMEAIERYSVASYKCDQFPLVSRDEVSLPLLEAKSVAAYGRLDIAGSNVTDESPRRWHPVQNLRNNTSYVVPIEFVRYPLPWNNEAYKPFDYATSSGLAAHFSRSLAIQAACHELIERDAFLIAWLRKASPPLIATSSASPRVQREIELFVREGWEVRLLDLTADLAPVIGVLATNPSKSYRHALGFASSDNVEMACLKALREARINSSLLIQTPRPAEKVLQNITRPQHHLELYATGQYDHLLMKLFGSEVQHEFQAVRGFSGGIVDRIHCAGLDVYAAELTAQNVRELAPNIHVVRVLIPGLVPIHFGRDWARTGSPRIMLIPEHVGWHSEATCDEELQRFPHPFN